MSERTVTKAIVSVSEMARMVGLSRARFYQLMEEGVFPPPTRPENGGRPFFDREQQERCLTVRRTNCGVDGRPILFYAMRPTPTTPPAPPRPTSPPPTPGASQRSDADRGLTALRRGLSQLGVDADEQSIRRALAECFPDGWSSVDHADLLRAVFDRVNRQDSNDNVAR